MEALLENLPELCGHDQASDSAGDPELLFNALVQPPSFVPTTTWRISRPAFHLGTYSTRPEASWSGKTRELLSYNLDFAELFDLPEAVLRSGFLCTDIELLQGSNTSQGSIIKHMHDTLVAGFEPSARITITLPRLQRKVLILAQAIHNDVHWICVPCSEDRLIAQLRDADEAAPQQKPINRNTTPYAVNMGRFSLKKGDTSKRSQKRSRGACSGADS